MSRYRVMTHMVAGYPDRERSLAVAKGLIEGGAAYLEIQFPFSDPSADGPVIQAACGEALSAGFSLDDGFALVSEVAGMSDTPIFIMSYANPVFTLGVEAFVARARKAGATGLIVPDLTIDADEGLYAAGREAGLAVVPVLVPTVSPKRLESLLKAEAEYLYIALRRGITGQETQIADETVAFLDRCAAGGAKLFAGFGIRNPEQIALLSPHVEAAVVGSALVEVITQSTGGTADDIYRDINRETRRLCGV